jgi:hypothetical protein
MPKIVDWFSVRLAETDHFVLRATDKLSEAIDYAEEAALNGQEAVIFLRDCMAIKTYPPKREATRGRAV